MKKFLIGMCCGAMITCVIIQMAYRATIKSEE